MSRHPRTDEIARGNHVVPVEFAQEMESELLTMSRLCDHLAYCAKHAPRWRSVNEDMPDDDQTVILHLQGSEVWTGFHDAGQWRFVSADPIHEPVLHWMPFPKPPEL
jgi:hypothetical protein